MSVQRASADCPVHGHVFGQVVEDAFANARLRQARAFQARSPRANVQSVRDPLGSGSRIAENRAFSPHIAVIELVKLLANPAS